MMNRRERTVAARRREMTWLRLGAAVILLALLARAGGIAQAQSLGVPYLVKDINQVLQPYQSSSPNSLVAVGNTLYFRAANVITGSYPLGDQTFYTTAQTVYQTDGTSARQVPFIDFFDDGYNLINDPLFNARGILAFSTSVNQGATSVQQLFLTDGTVAGTRSVDNASGVDQSLLLNGKIIFTSKNSLFQVDAAVTGAVCLKTLGQSEARFENFTVVNGELFFTLDDTLDGQPGVSHGKELWKTNGTAAGTILIKDINPGPNSSNPEQFTSLNGRLYFFADDGIHGQQLWRSSGSGMGTVMVTNIPGLGSQPFVSHNLIAIDGTLYFSSADGSTGGSLWKSDGTTTGTVFISRIKVDAANTYLSDFRSVNGKLLFYVNGFWGQGTVSGLWRSDGTAAGTYLLRASGTNASSWPSQYTLDNNMLYFTVGDSVTGIGLYTTDGTAAPVLVKSTPGPGASLTLLPPMNGALYFTTNSFFSSSILWRTDGTAAGTVPVVIPGIGSPVPPQGNFATLNGFDYFTASSPKGTGLWRTDWTVTGTVLLRSGLSGASRAESVAIGNTLYFPADDGVHGAELWKTDGTTAGTVLVTDLLHPTAPSFPDKLTNVNGTLFFTADDGIHGWALWKSNGYGENTVMVKTMSSLPDLLLECNKLLFFVCDDGAHGRELWRSDGTAAGTILLKDIRAGAVGASPTQLTDVNGTLFFLADDGVNGQELWKSDGTAAGTVMVKDIAPGAAGAGITHLTLLNNTLFFTADDGVNGMELWKSDGTVGGTVLVKDILPGADGSSPTQLTAVNGVLFFASDDGVNGEELWKSDGTAAGTVLVKNIYRGNASGYPLSLTAMNGMLYFKANDGSKGMELWKSDGTAAGTVLVKDINPGSYSSDPQHLTVVGSTLYMIADDGTHSHALWKSDGTAAGTVLVNNINPYGDPGIESLTGVNGLLFFAAGESQHGIELWKSDGTNAGTGMLRDIMPGSTGSYPNSFFSAGGMLLFSVKDPDHGCELWKSDGTAAGTVMFQEITSGKLGSNPANLTRSGRYIYFTAGDGQTGTELWGIPFPPLPAQLTPAPASLRFAADTPLAVDVEHGGLPTSQVLTVQNTGDFPLNFSGGNAATPGLKLTGRCAGDFQIAQVSPSTSSPLAPGATLTVTIRFAPGATRRTLGLDAALSITSDSPVAPVLSIPLLGDAVPVGLAELRVE